MHHINPLHFARLCFEVQLDVHNELQQILSCEHLGEILEENVQKGKNGAKT